MSAVRVSRSLFLNHIHIQIHNHIHSANGLQNLHLHLTIMQNMHLHNMLCKNCICINCYYIRIYKIKILLARNLMVTCCGVFGLFLVQFRGVCVLFCVRCARASFLRGFSRLCKNNLAFFASEVLCKICICIIRACKICICIHFY